MMRPRIFFESTVSLTASVAGQTYDLNNRTGIFLELYDLGDAPTERLAQRAPGQTGDTDLGGQTAPRFVDLAWRVQGRTLAHYRTLRETFLTVFRNRAEAVVLTFDFGDGRVRAVDVHLDGALDFRDRRYTQEVISGVFKASDPRLYDPTLRTVTYAVAGEGGLPIPFTVPIPIGADAINSSVTINYANGSRVAAAEYPTIIISGPISDPIIENLTTDEQIDLTGLSLAPAEFVTVDLSGFPRRDNKTIRNQDGDSVSQFLSTDSDLASWHLAYAGELLSSGTYADGDNVVRVLGSGATPQTAVELRYYNRYVGV